MATKVTKCSLKLSLVSQRIKEPSLIDFLLATQRKTGDKGYKEGHENDEGKKGHHDKEDSKKSYHEEDGHSKKHNDEGMFVDMQLYISWRWEISMPLGGYHHEHNKGEKGEKGNKWEEHGSFKKGHSTQGKHEVHKLDESKKENKFFDEDGDEGWSSLSAFCWKGIIYALWFNRFDEGGGYFNEESGHSSGGKKKSGHSKSSSHNDHYGKKGSHKKGSHHEDDHGHKNEGGHSGHHGHSEESGKKGGSSSHKKHGSRGGHSSGGGKGH